MAAVVAAPVVLLSVPFSGSSIAAAAPADEWSPGAVVTGDYEGAPAGDALPAAVLDAPQVAAAAGTPAVPVWVAPTYGFRFSYSPKLSVKYSDPQGTAGTVTFTVENRVGTILRTLTSPKVASGGTATVDLGAKPLDSDWYTAKAWASDGSLSSGKTSGRLFEISTSPTGTPGLGEKPFYKFEDFSLADRAQLQVNVADGNLIYRTKDLAIRGTAGHDLVLERVYNNQQPSLRTLGRGWSIGPAQQVGLYHAAGNGGKDLVFEDETQARWVLPYKAGSSPAAWGVPAGLNATVVDTALGWDLLFGKDKHRLIFDDSGRLEMSKDRNGNKIDLSYDALSQHLQTITDSQQRVTKFKLNPTSRRLESITDPAGRSTAYVHSAENLVGATDLAGKKWAYKYDHDLTSITDPRGNETRITYDGASTKVTSIVRVTDKAAGTGPTTKFAYYAAGKCPKTAVKTACTVVTDPNGHATTSGYDSSGRVTTVYDALGHKQATGYDALGNVTSVTGNGNGTSTPTAKTAYVSGTYKVSSMSSSQGGTATFTYDDPSVQSPTKYTTPQGSALNYTYRSGTGNLASIKSASGDEDRYRADYNSDGTLKSYSEPNLTTSSTSDRSATNLGYTGGNLTSLDLPAPLGNMTFTVDAYGRRTSQTDGKGQKTSYAYDGMDRVTKITYAAGPTVVYAYDGNGNQTSRTVTQAGATSGATTTYTYDALNRRTVEVKPDGSRISMSYDAVGNLRTFAIPAGTTSYTYDAVNLLATLTEPRGAKTSYAYDSDNNRTKVSYPNGVTVASTYNDAGAVKTIKATKGTAVYTNLAYAYDKSGDGTDDMGLRSKLTDNVTHRTTAYTYDTKYSQLTKALTKDSAGKTVKTYIYGYNVNGGRTSSSVDGVAAGVYSYNAANQLTKVGSGSFSYDANGNQLTGGGLTAAYNGRDQTTTVNGTNATYEDKDQAQRASYGSRAFLNTPLGVSSYTDTGAKTTTVTRESTGQLTALRQPTGSTSYPVTDALGSVIALTDTTGAKTDTFSYDPYGQDAGRTGTTANPFLFTGEYRDPSGLDKIGMRYYQPSTGRWTQVDPMRRATNPSSPPEASPYVYVGNNPVNFADPTGLEYTSCDFGMATVDVGVGITVSGSIALAGFSFGTSLIIGAAVTYASSYLDDAYCDSQE